MARSKRKPAPRPVHYVEEPRVVALHPGPDADFRFPTPSVETPNARLARLEREFLEASLKNKLGDFVPVTVNRADLARKIIVLRAEIAG